MSAESRAPTIKNESAKNYATLYYINFFQNDQLGKGTPSYGKGPTVREVDPLGLVRLG